MKFSKNLTERERELKWLKWVALIYIKKKTTTKFSGLCKQNKVILSQEKSNSNLMKKVYILLNNT